MPYFLILTWDEKLHPRVSGVPFEATPDDAIRSLELVQKQQLEYAAESKGKVPPQAFALYQHVRG